MLKVSAKDIFWKKVASKHWDFEQKFPIFKLEIGFIRKIFHFSNFFENSEILFIWAYKCAKFQQNRNAKCNAECNAECNGECNAECNGECNAGFLKPPPPGFWSHIRWLVASHRSQPPQKIDPENIIWWLVARWLGAWWLSGRWLGGWGREVWWLVAGLGG